MARRSSHEAPHYFDFHEPSDTVTNINVKITSDRQSRTWTYPHCFTNSFSFCV